MDENELITNKLADIRDNLFDESDCVSDEGYDLIPSYVGSPYEVLCGVERKILRQQKEIEQLKNKINLMATDLATRSFDCLDY